MNGTKIALVGDYPPPYGGVSVHVAALERALRASGVDARVLDTGRGGHEGPAVTRAARPDRGEGAPPRGSDRGAAAALGLGRGVLALGQIEPGAALATIAACDAFVRPSRADGDAVNVREALALGRAVVASDACRRPPGCLLFRAGDAAGLAARMLEATRLPPAPRGHAVLAPDPLASLLATYRTLARERPIPSDSRRLEDGPCSTP